MDIYCSNCGEPWDIDSLHDVIAWKHPDTDLKDYQKVFVTVRKDFSENGCKVFGINCTAKKEEKEKNSFMKEIYDIFDGDIEAAADTIEMGKRMGIF